MKRFEPTKRTALDGKRWWVVYDRKENKYSTYTCHGKYKTKWECQFFIDLYEKRGYYNNVCS